MSVQKFNLMLNYWNIFILISNMLFTTIVMLQTIEMFAMRYIIITQKDRKVEEILFDHEHEDVFNTDMRKSNKRSFLTKKSDQEVIFSFNDIQYRRREIRLKKWLNIALLSLMLVSFAFIIIYAIHEFSYPTDINIIDKGRSSAL